MKREPSCNSTAGTHDSQRRMLMENHLPPRPCPGCGWVLSAWRNDTPEDLGHDDCEICKEARALAASEWGVLDDILVLLDSGMEPEKMVIAIRALVEDAKAGS